MEAETKIHDHQEVKAPRMNRRQWKAARGNREDKWTRKHRLRMEASADLRKRYEEELERPVPEDEDPEVSIAMWYRDWWIKNYNGGRGSYVDTTSIPPMLYTDQPAPPYSAGCSSVLLIFSVKLTRLHKDLKWPLDVYGLVAARDSLDRNRNLIFNRSRDNCQTLTTEDDASLLLTGPSRAVVIIDPVHLEVELKTKGETPHEDKPLSLLLIDDNCIVPEVYPDRVFCHAYSSKFCTVEVTVGRLPGAVEATIEARVVEGSWPAQYHGWFAIRIASCRYQDMVLLDSRDGPVPIACDGGVELSRCVACVELDGELTFCVNAWQDDDRSNVVAKDQVAFTPKRASRSKSMCCLGFCKIEVSVAWSLLRNV